LSLGDVTAIVGFISLFALIALRVPIGIAMGLVGVFGFAAIRGLDPALLYERHDFLQLLKASDVGADDADGTLVRRSQESWLEPLLCAECEQTISDYERYGLELLRGRSPASVKDHAAGISFLSHDYPRFKLFLTSLIWRASVSRQPEFAKAKLPEGSREAARVSLLTGKALAPSRLGCRIFRLVDSSGKGDGAFDLENLQQLVITPFPRWRDGRRHYSLLFAMEGFVLEFFVPGVPYKQAIKRGIHKNSMVFFVPNKCIFSVPELHDLLMSGYAKHRNGQVAFADGD
jgi:hypothetical protein